MSDAGGVDDAVPGVDPRADRRRGQLLHTLEVDGEVFAVRGHDGGTDYHWVSGPNEGYGFGTSARDMPEDWHRESIRGFLSMVDPVTGFLEDE